MQKYGKSPEAISKLTAERCRVIVTAGYGFRKGQESAGGHQGTTMCRLDNIAFNTWSENHQSAANRYFGST
jgi:hypothetical protein